MGRSYIASGRTIPKSASASARASRSRDRSIRRWLVAAYVAMVIYSLPLVQKIARNLRRRPVSNVDRSIHAAHSRVRNAAREFRQHRPQPGISCEDILSNGDGAFVRREIAQVILQDDELGTRQHSIGCVGGGHLNPFPLKGRIEMAAANATD